MGESRPRSCVQTERGPPARLMTAKFEFFKIQLIFPRFALFNVNRGPFCKPRCYVDLLIKDYLYTATQTSYVHHFIVNIICIDSSLIFFFNFSFIPDA